MLRRVRNCPGIIVIIIITHAGIATGVGIAFSRVCLFVCLSVCLLVRALKGK